ncbi:hypothetical protein L2E82_14829 [Cichorium intybus]|uniref:Uncharacterized protein n=1 Tax=Cichorium intybus TaxID=13427 RepID=A0ACB9F155_CICIN|nr:hypothetical protein L2E82_14829 [Cichorium intybus]
MSSRGPELNNDDDDDSVHGGAYSFVFNDMVYLSSNNNSQQASGWTSSSENEADAMDEDNEGGTSKFKETLCASKDLLFVFLFASKDLAESNFHFLYLAKSTLLLLPPPRAYIDLPTRGKGNSLFLPTRTLIRLFPQEP